MPGIFRPLHLSSSPSFYIVHHLGFPDSFLNAPEHNIEACDTGFLYPMGSPIAEIASLLPRVERPPHDHPIFLSICHSPWHFLNQRSLALVRGFLALYMTTVIALSLYVEISYAKRGPLFVFGADNVSYFFQVVYYWISFVSFCMIIGHLCKSNLAFRLSSGRCSI